MADRKINTTAIKKLDVARYMGKWYEIARFNHHFEKGMVGVTAEYSWTGKRIRVINSGYLGGLNGKLKQAVGKAKIPDLSEPGKLKVSFFLFFYGDYYILELDENYTYALIGSSTDKYLWILSRTPQLPANTLEMLLARARERGYNTNKLIFVKQPSV